MRPPITWMCHVCGQVRPDEKISVYTYTPPVGRVEVKYNVRYCNDKELCRLRATNVAQKWAGKKP